jgi:hypothetical protein
MTVFFSKLLGLELGFDWKESSTRKDKDERKEI